MTRGLEEIFGLYLVGDFEPSNRDDENGKCKDAIFDLSLQNELDLRNTYSL